MREIIARAVCALTVGVVIALSFLFAWAHNPRAGEPVQSGGTPPPAEARRAAAERHGSDEQKPLRTEERAKVAGIPRGREVYVQQNCAACHSIADVGNPRHPLDGVGGRRDSATLRGWTTGTGVAADTLPAAIVKRKQRYQSIPEEDLAALVAYLFSLKLAK